MNPVSKMAWMDLSGSTYYFLWDVGNWCAVNPALGGEAPALNLRRSSVTCSEAGGGPDLSSWHPALLTPRQILSVQGLDVASLQSKK